MIESLELRAYVNICGSVFESSGPTTNDVIQVRGFTVDEDHMFPHQLPV